MKLLSKLREQAGKLLSERYRSGEGLPSPSNAAAPDPPSAPSLLPPPTLTDISRYRLHHGVNLGSIFVLERWLFGSLFLDSCQGSSELTAASAYIEANGIDVARAKWQKHWESISAEDWSFLKEKGGVTTVRLPIGWFTLGPEWCRGTPFESVGELYRDAWQAVKSIMREAAKRGIGVLLDLHALPGNSNGFDHGGTDSKISDFWNQHYYLTLATNAAVFIARDISSDTDLFPYLTGIQLVNEAPWGAADRGMFFWYDSTLSAIASIDPTLPVYISDAWDAAPALSYAAQKNNDSRQNPGLAPPVVVDVHCYYMNIGDHNQHPHEILDLVRSDVSAANSFRDKEVGVVIGEWSCVMSEESWARISWDERKILIPEFGKVQTERWYSGLAPVGGGAFFWTAKMGWMPGGEWGFFKQTSDGTVTPPLAGTLTQLRREEIIKTAESALDDLVEKAYEKHTEWWKAMTPKEKMEHWRYRMGYLQGFHDSLAFFRDTGATIGLINMWAGKRLRDHVREANADAHDEGWKSKYLWEYEHGVRKGVEDMTSFIKPT